MLWLVFSHLSPLDVLLCRRVCSLWRDTIQRHPAAQNIDKRANIPPDSQALSPMDRLLRVFSLEQQCRRNCRDGHVCLKSVPLEWSEVQAAAHVGKHLVVVQKSSWSILEEQEDAFRIIPHLSEAHDGLRDLVVLRDKFAVLILGQFVYAVDCGETLDLPNILRSGASRSKLFGNGDMVAVYDPDNQVHLYDFEVCQIASDCDSQINRNTLRSDGITSLWRQCSLRQKRDWRAWCREAL